MLLQAPPRSSPTWSAELPHAHSTHCCVLLAAKQHTAANVSLCLVSPVDPEAVVLMHSLLGEESDGVWSDTWPSARAAASVLLSQPELVRGCRVVELGSGCGLAGLAAAAAGCVAITFSDLEPRALFCALAGAVLNGHIVTEGSAFVRGLALPRRLEHAPAPAEASARVLDWTTPVPQELRHAFDVAVLCDVLYRAELVLPLARTCTELLAVPSGRIILTDTSSRRGKDGLRAEFVTALASHGLHLVTSARVVDEAPASVLDSNTGTSTPVEVLHFAFAAAIER